MIPPDIVTTLQQALHWMKDDSRQLRLTFGNDERDCIVQRIDAALQYLDTLPAAPDTREALAEYAHEAWSGWMKYLFSKCDQTGNTYATIPIWAVRRWQRQMNTPYVELPEEEKESDRAEADKMLAIMGRATLHARPKEDK